MPPKQVLFALKQAQATLAGIQYNSESTKLPIVAFHGWLDNAASFAPLAEHLKHPILAIDFPGHGLSSHSPIGFGYQWTDYLGQMHEFFQSHWEGPFILMGHSLGGGMSSLLAGLNPKGLTRLVLIEGLGIHLQAEEEAPDQFLRHMAARKRFLGKQGTLYKTKEEAETARFKAGDLTLEASKTLVSRQLRETSDGMFTFTYDQNLKWPSPIRMTEGQSKAYLSRIKTNTLVVAAEDSIHVGKGGWLEERLQLLENATMEFIPKGGHHLHMTQPEQTAKVIREFLGE